MENFRKFGLSEQLLKLLEKENIKVPTEIQEKVISLVLEGKDIIGGSATGTGKTLAFGAGIIEKTEKDKGLQVLILIPTRELAEQVGNVFLKYSGHKRLNVAIVYGGVNISNQIRSLRYSEIVVGTPGRILDHLQRGTINLLKLKILVLDEADRMLDMGFLPDVESIIKNCPKERQTLLFSATISRDIEHIARRHMKNFEFVFGNSYVNPEKLKQVYYDVPKNLKFSLLVHLLKKENHKLAMVFCNTRHNTDFVAENLEKFNLRTMAIHGGLTQKKRTSVMRKFNEKGTYVLVCTDVAARGLDIKGISHIYNYDIPPNSSDYIHRIGRTARAGKEGITINLLSDRDYENFSSVKKDSSLNIEKLELPKIEPVRIMAQNFPYEKRIRNSGRPSSGNWKSSGRNSRPPLISRGRNSRPAETSRGRNSRTSQTSGRRTQSSYSSKKNSGQRTIRKRF